MKTFGIVAGMFMFVLVICVMTATLTDGSRPAVWLALILTLVALGFIEYRARTLAEAARHVLRGCYYNRERPADSAMVWGATAIFVIAAVASGQLWAPLTFVFGTMAVLMHVLIWRGSYRYVRYELQLDERIQANALREQARI